MRCHLGTVKPVPQPPFIWCFQQPLVTPACVGFTCEDVKWWLSDSHAATLLAGALLQRQVLLTTFFSGLQDLCFSFSVIIFYCLYSLWCTNCPHLGRVPSSWCHCPSDMSPSVFEYVLASGTRHPSSLCTFSTLDLKSAISLGNFGDINLFLQVSDTCFIFLKEVD